jgi:hypothetical protein
MSTVPKFSNCPLTTRLAPPVTLMVPLFTLGPDVGRLRTRAEPFAQLTAPLFVNELAVGAEGSPIVSVGA